MPATVKGGFWEVNGVSSLTSVETTSALKKIASQALGKKQTYSFRRMMEILNGQAPGSLASKNLTRVQAAVELGGVRPIETEVLINRNTTAADRSEVTADILSLSSKTTFGSNPVANRDGNPLGTR